MPIPDFQALMRRFLVELADGKSHALADVHDALCSEFQLTPEEIAKRISSGRQTVMRNRVGWTRTYLSKAGLVSIPQKGFVRITERGGETLAECPTRVDVKYLKRFEEFRQFHSPKTDENEVNLSEPVDVPPRSSSHTKPSSNPLPMNCSRALRLRPRDFSKSWWWTS